LKSDVCEVQAVEKGTSEEIYELMKFNIHMNIKVTTL
jgi:hypothetical protein